MLPKGGFSSVFYLPRSHIYSFNLRQLGSYKQDYVQLKPPAFFCKEAFAILRTVAIASYNYGYDNSTSGCYVKHPHPYWMRVLFSHNALKKHKILRINIWLQIT